MLLFFGIGHNCRQFKGLDSIDPIDQRGDEAQAGEEISSGFVVAGCNGSKILQAAECSFDDIAQTIKFGVEREELLAVDFVGNDRCRAASVDAQMIRVVTFVADQSFARRCRREQGRGALDVGDVSARQQEGVRAAVFVDERVDFCRAPAARAADSLILRPPFRAPLAERCALTAELSIIVSVGGSPHPTSTANICCHRPRWLQRLYRLKTVVYGPYPSGSARHRQPSRKRWIISR